MITLKRRVDTLFLPEHGYYKAYGVDVYDKQNMQLIFSVEDISLEPEKVNEFVELCNGNDVDEIHLYELIENFFLGE